jgi:hypothetical protein
LKYELNQAMEELQQNCEYLILQHKLAFMQHNLKEFEDRRIKGFRYEQKPIGSL